MVEHKKQAIKQARAANIPAAPLLTWPELWLRPADRLDHAIRRLVTPVPSEVNPVAAIEGVSPDASPNEGLLTDIQVRRMGARDINTRELTLLVLLACFCLALAWAHDHDLFTAVFTAEATLAVIAACRA